MVVLWRSGDESWMLRVPARGGGHFRSNDGQHPFAKVGLEFIEIEIVAKPELELIVVLHAFEVEGLPVDADDMGFAGGDDEVWSAGGDFNPVGFHSRHEHDQFQSTRQIGALEVWLAISRQGLSSVVVVGTV